MKQRALIALSLVLDPDLLVMDEPTGALDLLMQRSIISLLEDIKEKHDITIVLISHDLPLVADIADRLAVMYAFEFAEVGPASRILDEPARPYTRALRWATPELGEGEKAEESPIRTIDVPDQTDMPSGCRYHTRCMEAREVCTEQTPELFDISDDVYRQNTACFRVDENHEYWQSEPITTDSDD